LPEGSAVKETLGGRRKRLREAVAALLGAAGWKMVKANVFEKLGAASPSALVWQRQKRSKRKGDK